MMARWFAPIAAFAAALGCATAAAGTVWTWTDPSGRVHYGDRPPAERSARQLPMDPPAADAPARRPAAVPPATGRTARPAAAGAGTPPRAAAPMRIGEGPEPTTCEGRWRRFNDSAACFSRFRVVGGGVKSDAYRYCAEVPTPERCD
jgi:hypothetical protein